MASHSQRCHQRIPSLDTLVGPRGCAAPCTRALLGLAPPRPVQMLMISSLRLSQPATATCTPGGAASTWSSTSCPGARAAACASTAGTTPRGGTATTARRASTGTSARPSRTARPAKVSWGVLLAGSVGHTIFVALSLPSLQHPFAQSLAAGHLQPPSPESLLPPQEYQAGTSFQVQHLPKGWGGQWAGSEHVP